MRLTTGLSFVLLFLGVSACAGSREAAAPPEVVFVENIDASGEAEVYYSLRENRIVDAGEAWDLSFQSTNIRANGSAQVLQVPFEAIDEAPEAGYREDTPEAPAIPAGSGNGWYQYEPSEHLILPIPGRTLVFRFTDGTYAKLEVLDFYLPGVDEPRFYTFRYAHQTARSRRLQ